MEAFLLNADLSNFQNVNTGVTGSKRATASDGNLTHDVHIQNVDQRRRGGCPGRCWNSAAARVTFYATCSTSVASLRPRR